MKAIFGIDIVEQMRFVVQATEDAILCKLQAEFPSMNIERINYLYGRAQQINAELLADSSAPIAAARRYPVIALVEPVTISQPSDGGYPYATGFGILIMVPSMKNALSYDRQKYVERLLYPIYHEFMNQLAKTRSFVTQNPKKDLAHSVTVHKGNPFYSETCDIIELKGLQLKFYPSYSN